MINQVGESKIIKRRKHEEVDNELGIEIKKNQIYTTIYGMQQNYKTKTNGAEP